MVPVITEESKEVRERSTLSVIVPTEMRRGLEHAAEASDRSVGAVVRQAIRSYLVWHHGDSA